MPKLKIAVVGAGQFGQNHIRVVQQSPDAELVAVVDPDPSRANVHGVPGLSSIHGLDVDAAIVSAPTTLHRELGCALMAQGIDVLIEKPIAPDLASADFLIEMAARSGRILQVGHLERFNPAVQALEAAATIPLFLKSTG